MADAVVRLRVESSEYDQKLQRATQQLQHMEKEVRRTGATFAYADKEELEFIKSLGSMETKADSAKGKIAEMTKSFTELSLQYNRLTKEEKASPFGNALASSLDQLKTRIKDSKSELAGVEGQLTSFGDVAKQMGAKLGIPVEQLTKFGPYGVAAAAALKVASDAFKQNEEFMDEWGRTTEAAGTVYQGFLNALNTGDLGVFLRNIGKIISKAREAYDAMDQLGTFNAFNQIQIEGARTDFTEAMANYREGSGSKEDVKAAADRLKNEMQSRKDKEQAAYIAAIKELAASRGVDEEMLKKALSGTYGDYETLKNKELTGVQTQYHANQFGAAYTTTTKVAANEEERLGEMLRKLNDDELAHIQSLGAQAQRTATEIAQVNKQTVRVLGAQKTNGTVETKSNAGSFRFGNYLETPAAGSLADLQRQASVVQASMGGATTTEEYKDMEAHLQTIIDKMNQLKGITEVTFVPGSLNDLNNQLKDAQAVLANMSPEAEGWADALEDVRKKMAAVAALQEQINKSTSTKNVAKDMNGLISNVQGAIGAFGQLGNAMQQIEDPSAKVAGIIMGAIANVAATFAASLKGTFTPWDWIAAAIAGTATMISTIAAIKSATAGSYASGGIVPGNSFSGDNLTANVNSGELILNKAQQSNLAGQLNGNAMGNLRLTTDVSGKNLRIVLNNDNRSLGGSRNFYSKVH